MCKYKTIVWDLDGTLLDTLQDLFEATNYALRTHGLPERTLEEVRQFVGNGVRLLMIRAVPGGESHPAFEAIFATFKAYYVEHCQDHTGLYPGIEETLRALKAKGVRMAIVSNKLQAGVDQLYDELFRDWIEVAIGESPAVNRKPAPDMVEMALKKMGLTKDEIVYVGDSDVDIATARNAGIPCISVLWGFREKDFLIAHGATELISEPKELLRFV